MNDLIQIKSGVVGDRTEMPSLEENEFGYRRDEQALYIGTAEGNVRLCGAKDVIGGADDLNAIGDAIRDITGETEFIPVADMPMKVYEVYDKGKNDVFSEFWKNISANYTRTIYDAAFSYWQLSPEIFRPLKTLTVQGSSQQMFYFATCTEPIDIQAIEAELGYPVLSTTGAIRLDYFNNPGIFSTLGDIDISQVTVASYLQFLFATNTSTNYLTSIRKLIVSSNTAFANTMFRYCSNLAHCVFEGTIATNGLDMSACTKLDHESLMSIINCLATKTSGTWTVTLGTTNLNKLTAD